MRRQAYGWGYNLPQIIGEGGGLPTEPTGFVAKYTAYLVDNFTLVTGDSVNVWQDESVNSNDLTQGTSANQPKLVEDNTVTQFTASNQPTFAKDKQVTQETASNQPTFQKDKQVSQDTLANMPTYDATEGALEFGNFDRLGGLPVSKTYRHRVKASEGEGLFLLSSSTTTARINIASLATQFYITYIDDAGLQTNVNTPHTYSSEAYDVTTFINGNELKIYIDNTLMFDQDITGRTFDTLDTLNGDNLDTWSLLKIEAWISPVADPTNIVETPDFELDGSDPTTMLNDSDAQPVNGDSVRLWHDPSAVDVMAFEPTSRLTGYSNQGNDDFVFEVDLKFDNGDNEWFLSSSSASSIIALYYQPNNALTLRDDTGASVSFNGVPTSLVNTQHRIKFVKSGNSLSCFLDDVEFDTSKDVTGQTFYLYDTLGAFYNNGSLTGNVYSFKQWNSAVSTGTPDFELTADPTTMVSDSFTTPTYGEGVRLWHDPSAVDVLAFDPSSNLQNISIVASPVSFEFVIKQNSISDQRLVVTSDPFFESLKSNGLDRYVLRFTDNTGITLTASGIDKLSENKIKFVLDGATEKLFVNDVLVDTSSSGKYIEADTIGGNSFSMNGVLKSYKQWNSADSSGAPDFTLTPDSTKLRTSANANPVLGEDVAKWYADEFSAYRDSRVVFDATDDNMSGLPALTGDWSYMIDTSINTLGTTKYLLEQTAGSSAILALADDLMYLRDTTGANDIALTSYTLTTGRTQFGFVRSGDDLLYYVNGVLKETVDVTGRTFDFGTVGKSATSADMDTKQIIPFDRALTQTEIDYYSYLRSETGDILTNAQGEPLGLS